MIRYMEFLKSFDASNESGKMWATGWFLEGLQHPLNAPSVFNFFLPTYSPSGLVEELGFVAPEFELLNSTIAIEYINMMMMMTVGETYMESITQASPEDIGQPWWDIGLEPSDDHVGIDIEYEILLGSENPAALIDRLDILLCGGTMSSDTRSTILNVIDNEWLEPIYRFQIAIYMVLISPDYVIQK